MIKLSWPDIFVDASLLDFTHILSLWPHTVSGSLRPIGASVFGDLFFERPDGKVEKLDVLEGGVHLVASSFSEFSSLMNSASWQESELLTEGIALLLERGMTRESNQFFAFAPHPAFTGTIDWNRAMPMDAIVWHNICAQALNPA